MKVEGRFSSTLYISEFSIREIRKKAPAIQKGGMESGSKMHKASKPMSTLYLGFKQKNCLPIQQAGTDKNLIYNYTIFDW